LSLHTIAKATQIIVAVNIFVIEAIRNLFAAVKGFFTVPSIWV